MQRHVLTGVVVGVMLTCGAVAAPIGGTRWTLHHEVDKLDGTKTVGILARAFDTALDKPRRETIINKTGYLSISCTKGVTNFIFRVPGELVASHLPIVSYRIDKGAAVKNQRWSAANDDTGVGLWKSAQSVPFLKKLAEGSDFFIRVEQSVFGTTEASFNLAEIKDALKPIREACKW